MRVLLGLTLLVVAVSAFIPMSPNHFKRKLFERQQLSANVSAQWPWLEQYWFDQKLDHFDPLNTKTWQQKYYYNPKYDRGNSIIFLMIGGEGPEGPHWAGDPSVQYLQWAAEYGALVFDLEHRFFGDSWPIRDMETSSLSLLTTQQALADIADFIQAMNQKYGFNNPRWVTFGGSYPGALAAWFRQKYPHLTVGSVASSAPVNLKLDFYEYAMVVQDDLYLTELGCAPTVQAAFTLMQNLSMTEAGRQQLSTTLHLDPPFAQNATKLDITNFFGNIYNVFQGMTQYTYDGQSNKTHMDDTDARLCSIMDNATDSNLLDRTYNLIIWYNKLNGDPSTTFQNDYYAAIAPMSSGNLSVLLPDPDTDYASARGWMWLCCNEIGYMQTTDQGSNIFGDTIPLNYFIDMCTDMFGPTITMDHVYNGNAAAQKYYGGADKYYATNIVLPNGSLDPWHALGTYINRTSVGLTTKLINGTAHCSDMYPAYQGEPADLAESRAYIKSQVQTFIRYDPIKDGVQTSPVPQTSTTAAPTQGSTKPAPVKGSTSPSNTPAPTAPASTQSSSTPASSTGSAAPTSSQGPNSTAPTQGPPATTTPKGSATNNLLTSILVAIFVSVIY